MDHRIKSGGDESESGLTVAFHSSDAETHRENEILFTTRARRQRVAGGEGWGTFLVHPHPGSLHWRQIR